MYQHCLYTHFLNQYKYIYNCFIKKNRNFLIRIFKRIAFNGMVAFAVVSKLHWNWYWKLWNVTGIAMTAELWEPWQNLFFFHCPWFRKAPHMPISPLEMPSTPPHRHAYTSFMVFSQHINKQLQMYDGLLHYSNKWNCAVTRGWSDRLFRLGVNMSAPGPWSPYTTA